MEVRLLEYFVASADAGSFTAAADALRISQPSLSEGIRKLESELAAPLFHRVGRGIVLTESGQFLLPRARHILQQVDEARDEMVALKGLRGGRVRIGAPPGLTVDPLARLIGSFRSAFPAVTISMFPAEDGGIAVQAVLSAQCEIGIVDRPAQSSELVAHVIARNEIMVAAPPGSRFDGSASIGLEALAGMPFISSFPGTRTRTVLDGARESGIDLPVVVETPHREAVVPLVVAGVASAFLTGSVAREAAKQGAVVLALDPPLSYDVYLIHRAKPLTRAAAAFVGHALQDRVLHGGVAD
jgi:LysR family carnitine catabolism transcriptional activator